MAEISASKQASRNVIEAVSHPVREEILRILSDRQASPAEMARELDEPVANVSHHTKRLVALDCAELVEERKVRGAVEHVYRATHRPLIIGDDWNELDTREGEALVGSYMERILEDFNSSARARMVGADAEFHITRTPLVVDQEGLEEALALAERYREAMLDVVARAALRRTGGADSHHISSSIALFKMPAPGTG